MPLPEYTFDSSWRKDRNGKDLIITNGKKKQLVDEMTVHAGKVDGSYNGKEKDMFHEVKLAVRKGVLSKAVRKPMRRGMNSGNVWEVEEGLMVREVGEMMELEERSMGEETLLKN